MGERGIKGRYLSCFLIFFFFFLWRIENIWSTACVLVPRCTSTLDGLDGRTAVPLVDKRWRDIASGGERNAQRHQAALMFPV